MVAGTTLEGALAAFREQEIGLIGDLLAVLSRMPEADSDERRRLEEVVRDLREMFYLIVVIGEFNAGKSSLINALLNDQLLKSGVTPTTDLIDVVRYSETAQRVPVMEDGSVRMWAHPNSLAPGVALVDTPGTGSVFKRHEDTAKSFLHRSDLVIFVISGKRALAETERLYLDLARNYGKKIILVINQVDLLSLQERGEVKRFVERQVEELLQLRPLIFMVSARDALAGAGDDSGVPALRAHLRSALTESPPAHQKLAAQLDFIERMALNNLDRVKVRGTLVDVDSLMVRDLERELGEQSGHMDQPLASARAEIDRAFESMRVRGHAFIQERLSLRRIGRSLDRAKLRAAFEETVIGRTFNDVHEASLAYVNTLVDGSRTYWRSVIDRLNQLHELLGEIEGTDTAAFVEQREALQEAVRLAEAQFNDYSSARVVEELDERSIAEVNKFAVSVVTTVVGVIAAVAAVATPGVLTAAPLATAAFALAMPVVAIAGVGAVVYWRRATANVRDDFDVKVNGLKTTYGNALDNLTRKEKVRLQQYGQQVLAPIFSRLEVLALRYASQEGQLESILANLKALRRAMEERP